MSVEQAIIELVVSNVGLFATTNEKVQADLTSTERAGRRAEGAAASAENAAKEAEQANRRLASEISNTFSRLSSAISFAKNASRALGVDPSSKLGFGLDLVGDSLQGAAQGAQFGSILGAKGAVVGGAAGAFVGFLNSSRQMEEKIAEQNRRSAEKERKALEDQVNEAILREVGLVRFGNKFGPRQIL